MPRGIEKSFCGRASRCWANNPGDKRPSRVPFTGVPAAYRRRCARVISETPDDCECSTPVDCPTLGDCPTPGGEPLYNVAGSIRWSAGGSRKRPLVHRRPSVPESSPARTTQIRAHMGDSKSGVVLGSRLLETDRAANRRSGSPPGVGHSARRAGSGTSPRKSGSPDVASRLARHSLPEFMTMGRSWEFQTTGRSLV